jgi:hypothetical protein
MLKDNIITVLTNFIAYFFLHKDFRDGLISSGIYIGEALMTDIISPELPMPAAASLIIKD